MPQDETAKRGLIVRSDAPQQFETPVTRLSSWLTPNEVFFVRNHLGVPAEQTGQFALEFVGELDNRRSFTLEQLQEFEVVKLPATLQCAGNGRAFYEPLAAGVPWERGAIGNAEWTGVRLGSILTALGLRPQARHIQFRSWDEGTMPDTAPWTRSIPLERALDPSTLVAFRMNDAPLPRAHGGPLRLVVPGWTGCHWCKWLRQAAAQADECDGYYMRSAYRIPTNPARPDADREIRENPLKSIIFRPFDGAILTPGRHEVSGAALTGSGAVKQVEVSISGEPWQPAELDALTAPGTWQLWRYDWIVERPDVYTLAARAIDQQGSTQPAASLWNKNGYLWNGIDRVRCEVR